MHDISILHDIFFTFYGEFSSFFYFQLRAIVQEVFIFHDFGTDETFFKVRVDDSRCLRRCPADTDSPCPYFLHACREISLALFVSFQFIDIRFYLSC